MIHGTELLSKKRAELVLELAGLRRNYAMWRNDAAVGAPLAQLHVQIVRITRIFDSLVQRLEQQLDSTPTTMEGLTLLDRAITDIDELWHWYSSRLAIRYSSQLAGYINAADAFVWACCEPVYRAMAITSGNLAWEPPLVSIESRRGVSLSFRTDLEPIAPKMIARIPVPLIGVPTAMIQHVPSFPLLAHGSASSSGSLSRFPRRKKTGSANSAGSVSRFSPSSEPPPPSAASSYVCPVDDAA